MQHHGKILASLLVVLVAISTVTYVAVTGLSGGNIVQTIQKTVNLGLGESYTLYYNSATHTITPVETPEIPLSSKAIAAVNRAPVWIRERLANQFRALQLGEIDVGSRSKPAFADLNGDGLKDMVVSESAGGLTCYLNIGSLMIPLWKLDTTIFASINVGANAAPAFADLNADGLVDLIIGNAAGDLAYYRNVGTSTNPAWLLDTTMFAGIHVSGNAVPTSVDLTNDGKLDLVIGSQEGTLTFYENTGTTTSPLWTLDEKMFPTWIESVDYVNYYRTGVCVSSEAAPAFVDVDGSGRLSLIIGAGDGKLHVFINTGEAGSQAWAESHGFLSDVDVPGNSAPAFVDLNGDDKPDFAIGSQNGFVYYIRNMGTLAMPNYPVWISGEEETLLATWFWGPAYYSKIDNMVAKVTEEYEDIYADLINNAEAPYVDEIAYAVACDFPPKLKSLASSAYLYELNAKGIYEIAPQLKYVKIVEKKQYTTLAYRTDAGKWKELPKDIYYKFVVMFNRYMLNEAYWAMDRYHGYLYRQFLPYDNTYGVTLLQAVQNANTIREAAYAIDHWLRVDIGAWWHPGPKPPGWYNIYMNLNNPAAGIWCGEFSIIVEAAARAVLIPTIIIVNIAEDHQFNNYWYDNAWWHWDSSSGVLDNPLAYFGTWPMEWEQNGPYDDLWRSEVAYSPAEKLFNAKFFVHDRYGRPIDGARVEAWSHWPIESGYDTAPYIAGLTYTDLSGKATIPRLSFSRTLHFTFYVITKLGYVKFTKTIDEPRDYNFDVTVDVTLPVTPHSISTNQASDSKYRLSIGFDVVQGMQTPPCWIAAFKYTMYWLFKTGNHVDIYVMSPSEYENYKHGYDFKVLAQKTDAEYGTLLNLPIKSDAYIVFSNLKSITTTQTVQFTICLSIGTIPPVKNPVTSEIIPVPARLVPPPREEHAQSSSNIANEQADSTP